MLVSGKLWQKIGSGNISESVELRGRLSAFATYAESTCVHVVSDLLAPSYAPPSVPSGDAIVIEVTAVARRLKQDIRTATPAARSDLDLGGITAEVIGRTILSIERAMHDQDLGGGAAGDLVEVLKDLRSMIT